MVAIVRAMGSLVKGMKEFFAVSSVNQAVVFFTVVVVRRKAPGVARHEDGK
jgi:hypothetical protein